MPESKQGETISHKNFMCKTDQEYLEKLRAHAAEARTFLSSKMKPERERSVCRAFLRTLGVPFKDSELIAPTDEPADVAFREARFQVRDLLRPDHRRGDDWKKRQKKYGDATSVDDVMEEYSAPSPVDLETLIPEIATALSSKAKKYGRGCKDVDALIYADLKDRFLATGSSVRNLEPLKLQGWRSVSLLFPPCGIVLLATKAAPGFLQEAEGEVRTKWANIDTLFKE